MKKQHDEKDLFGIWSSRGTTYVRLPLVAFIGGILSVVILAITRMGIVTPQQLRKQRRVAILVIAVLAALLPGGDPVTMLLMMAPILVLYEGSILLAALLERRAARAREREEAEIGSELAPFDSDD